MVKVIDVARYIYTRYFEQFSASIDEMKLHKLLYFAQRESIIQNNEPLFDAAFHGWKYGPVLLEVRDAYRDNNLNMDVSRDTIRKIKPVIDVVFRDYAGKDSWSLSRLTHGEYSWKMSREGVPETENSDRLIKIEDIGVDAQRLKERKEMLRKLGLI